MAPPHQPAGGHQQRDQGPEAHRLRLPGRRLLLPQDQVSLPRKCVKNRFKTFHAAKC